MVDSASLILNDGWDALTTLLQVNPNPVLGSERWQDGEVNGFQISGQYPSVAEDAQEGWLRGRGEVCPWESVPKVRRQKTSRTIFHQWFRVLVVENVRGNEKKKHKRRRSVLCRALGICQGR